MHHLKAVRAVFSLLLSVSLLATGLYPSRSFAGPVPSGFSRDNILSLTPSYVPLTVKGLAVHPQDPFQFDFIVDTGKSGLSGRALLHGRRRRPRPGRALERRHG